MKNKIKRAVISVVVFAVIYILSGFIIGWHSYDMYLKALEFLAAIICRVLLDRQQRTITYQFFICALSAHLPQL